MGSDAQLLSVFGLRHTLQGSEEFSNYCDTMYMVDSPEQMRELVHRHLEYGLTRNEHWEMALTADLHVRKSSEPERVKRLLVQKTSELERVKLELAVEKQCAQMLEAKVKALEAEPKDSGGADTLMEK
eukprot:8306417-Pyramimonas_sp.AAC.2